MTDADEAKIAARVDWLVQLLGEGASEEVWRSLYPRIRVGSKSGTVFVAATRPGIYAGGTLLKRRVRVEDTVLFLNALDEQGEIQDREIMHIAAIIAALKRGLPEDV
jgi:DNA topoisomerase IB